jgi:hypothetical protein
MEVGRAGITAEKVSMPLAEESASRLRRVALDASFDGSQFLSAIDDGGIGGGQKGSQSRLSQQVALDLQDQPLELGGICHSHEPKLPLLVGAGCFKLHSLVDCPRGCERVSVQ